MSGLPVMDEIPVGVRLVRDYRGGISMLECSHAEQHRAPYLVAAGSMCTVCRADERATMGFVRPVKLFRIISPDARAARQEALF